MTNHEQSRDPVGRRLRRITVVSRAARFLLLLTVTLMLCSRWLPFWFGDDGVIHFTIGQLLRVRWELGISPWPALAEAMVRVEMPWWLWLELPQSLFLCAWTWQLHRVFLHFERGEVFTASVVARFSRLAGWLIAWALVLAIYPAIVTTAAQLLGYSSTPLIWFEADWSPLLFLAGGLLIWVIAWVMHEGLQLRNEQDLTI